MVNKSSREYYSTSEAARVLGISRIAVFKKITRGEMRAQRVGRNYIIAANDLSPLRGNALHEHEKGVIKKAVQKAINEYNEMFKLLSHE